MVTFPDISVLQDAFVKEFNQKIVTMLPWLNNPLGYTQFTTQKTESGTVTIESMHTDSGEYLRDVLPNDELVNFSWFRFDPLEINGRPKSKYKVTGSWNLFIDLRKITPRITRAREINNAKAAIIYAIQHVTLKCAALRAISISEKFQDVYPYRSASGSVGSIEEINEKYTMQPYCALSVKITGYIKNLCPIPSNKVVFLGTDIPGENVNPNYVPTGDEIIIDNLNKF